MGPSEPLVSPDPSTVALVADVLAERDGGRGADVSVRRQLQHIRTSRPRPGFFVRQGYCQPRAGSSDDLYERFYEVGK